MQWQETAVIVTTVCCIVGVVALVTMVILRRERAQAGRIAPIGTLVLNPREVLAGSSDDFQAFGYNVTHHRPAWSDVVQNLRRTYPSFPIKPAHIPPGVSNYQSDITDPSLAFFSSSSAAASS